MMHYSHFIINYLLEEWMLIVWAVCLNLYDRGWRDILLILCIVLIVFIIQGSWKYFRQ